MPFLFLNRTFHQTLTALSYLCLASSGLSEELPDTFTGIRPLGMGGAFTAIANDENSVWTNPGGVARVRKARSRRPLSLLSLPTLIGGGNSGGRKFFLSTLGRTGGPGSAVLGDIVADLDTEKGETVWARSAASSLAFFDYPKGSPWVAGGFINVKTRVAPEVDASQSGNFIAASNVVVDNVTDVGGVFSFAWTNRTNRLNFGLTFRPTVRYGYYDKTDIESLVSKFKSKVQSDGNNGRGLGIDAGLLWTFADYWFPSLGLAIKNLPTGCIDNYLNAFSETRQRVCGTKFSGTVNNPESPALLDPTDIRVGVSMTPRLGRKVALRFAVDIHNLFFTPDDITFYGLSGVEPLKQLHAGVELFFGNPLLINPFSLRAGFNQGFMSFGGTFRMGFFVLEAAVYERDISSGPTGKKDSRYLASLSFTFH